MGGSKKAPAKKTDEEKAEEKRAKACANMLKAAKDNELAKVQKAIESEGADINFANEVRALARARPSVHAYDTSHVARARPSVHAYDTSHVARARVRD